MYLSYHQFTDGRIALVVRSHGDIRAMAPVVLQAIRSVDSDQPVYDVRALDDVLARSTAQRRLNAVLVVVFAVCALVLAGVGLYGAVAYAVTQRRREFGVRVAVGAVPSDVAFLILRDGSMMAACGGALAASYLPARRAALTDPVRALRTE